MRLLTFPFREFLGWRPVRAGMREFDSLENGRLRAHICRMGHNATMAVVAAIIVTAAIYSLWMLRMRK